MDATLIFITLCCAGLLLMGAEIFVPGGVLGVLGAVALMGAVAAGFAAFGPQQGVLAALLILVFLGLSIVLWMQLIPRSSIGRKLTLAEDLGTSRSATTNWKEWRGKEGEAVSPLGPAGVVKIDGRRLDAVAEGRWIDAGARVRVVHVTGNHLTVRAITAAARTETPPAADA